MKATRPFSPFEWMVALRYLRAKRAESFISVISVISLVGIALGVAALIIVTSVMNGFREDLMGRILGLNGHMTVMATSGRGITDYDTMAARIAKVPGVVHVAPLVQGFAAVDANGVATGVQVRGLRRADIEALPLVAQSIPPAALDAYGEDTVLIGSRLADSLGLIQGLDLKIMGLHGDVTPFGTTPRVKNYTVAGLFNIGMSEYDRTVIFMPLDQAQLFFNYDNAVPQLEIMIDDPDRVDAMRKPVEAAAGDGVRVLTWKDTQSSFFQAVEVEHVVMFLILTLIIIVAALNIVSGLYMLVKDKSADIAILRSMGATRGAVMRIFLITGLTIGVAGTFIGFLIGVLFCSNIETIRVALVKVTGVTLFDPTIYFLSHMPAHMDMMEVAMIVALSLFLSFVATLYPAWRAARLDPVEALRYE